MATSNAVSEQMATRKDGRVVVVVVEDIFPSEILSEENLLGRNFFRPKNSRPNFFQPKIFSIEDFSAKMYFDRKLFLTEICLPSHRVIISDGPPNPQSHNYRRSIETSLLKAPALIDGFRVRNRGTGPARALDAG